MSDIKTVKSTCDKCGKEIELIHRGFDLDGREYVSVECCGTTYRSYNTNIVNDDFNTDADSSFLGEHKNITIGE